MPHIQTDMFADQPQWLDTVTRKLPIHDFLSVMDVALAFGVSPTKVTVWIEEGRLEAANLNAGLPRKAFWKIPRSAALSLAKRIADGV